MAMEGELESGTFCMPRLTCPVRLSSQPPIGISLQGPQHLYVLPKEGVCVQEYEKYCSGCNEPDSSSDGWWTGRWDT